MGEPHDSLLAFLSDIDHQVEVFAGTNDHKIVRDVTADLRTRLTAQGLVVTIDASLERTDVEKG